MKIFSLVNHFPSRDPRVIWSAGSLAKKADVTIIGKQEPGYKLKSQVNTGYKISLIEPKLTVDPDSIFKIVSIYKSQALLLVMVGVLFSPIGLWIYLPGRKRLADVLKRNRSIYNRIISIKAHHFYQMITLFFRMVTYSLGIFAHMKKRIETGETVNWLANDLDTLLAAVILKRYYGGILVYDMHEFWPYAKSQKNTLLFLLEKRLINHVDVFITVSPFLRDEIKSQYKIEKVFYVVPNASPKVNNGNGSHSRNRSLQLNREDINFLFQGGFSKERGLEFIIDCWSLEDIPAHCKLWIRGKDNDYKSSLLAILQNRPSVNDNIHFIPAVSEEDLIRDAMPFDVGIIPYQPVSLNNKFCCPNKLSQYMQASLAILHNDLPFVQDIVSSANCGTQYVGNKNSFIDAVKWLASDAIRLGEYQRNAQLYANSEFHWEKYEPFFLKAYNLDNLPDSTPLLFKGKTRNTMTSRDSTL